MLKHPYHLLITLLTVVLAASCADDLATQDTPAPGEGEGIVRLSVPGTRSIPTTDETGEADATDLERAVRDLWFLAYPTDGQGEPVIQRLNTDELEHEYQTFSIRMPFGTYQIYVVANIDGISPATTESDLQSILLNYKEGETLALPHPEDGLPMSYQHPQTFTVDAQGGTLRADLVYCCVKVRYTLLFDNRADGGLSHSAFGDNYLRITSVGGRNVATQVPLLPTGRPVESQELMDTDDDAFNGHYADGEYTEAVHETLAFTSDEPQENGTWAYRGTLYLPEHYVAADRQADQTSLRVAATLYNAEGTPATGLEYTIELGEDLAADNDETRQLPRGRYYDITGRITTLGDKIETTVAVQDWTPVEVNTELESPYHLWVQETEIDSLAAGQTITIPCRTDAPKLEADPTNIKIETSGVGVVYDGPLYIVTFNEDYTAFTVQLHPNIPPGTTWSEPEQYNYILIRIPDPEVEGEYLLSKRIDIQKVSTKPYFVVTPKQYTLYISEIGNMEYYDAVFTYETNMQEVAVKCGTTDVTTTGISWEENEHVTITDSGLNDGTGTVTVRIDQPYQPSFYPRTQTVVLDYTATDNRSTSTVDTDQTRVTIIPNAQTYRLHFRPVNDSWTNPHIYVYEALYTPNGSEVMLSDQTDENAVLYGFTGKRTFKGWDTQGGSISWSNWTNNTATDQVNGGSNIFDPEGGSGYTTDIDYCPTFRTDCCENSVNPKWPGVKMKVDTENPGWFYFDLPALAEPGKALIMFADGHSAGNDPQDRYPAHMVPGVPLYDYADKDGWFLYNWNEGDQNEFVDDKPAVPVIETLSGSTLPDGVYRIYARRTHFWIWENGGDYYTSINWPGYQATSTMGKDGENPYYYYVDMVVDKSSRPSWNPGSVQCAVTNEGKDRIDRTIAVGDWKRVQGSSYYYYVIN